MFNQIVRHYRARVEHINAKFDSHQMFQTNFRGGLNNLTSGIYITAMTLNVQLHKYPCYPPEGPWSHFPNF